jgi:hypothetical protein
LGENKLQTKPNWNYIRQFERKALTAKLAEVFSSLEHEGFNYPSWYPYPQNPLAGKFFLDQAIALSETAITNTQS